jgi:hypothetical protein
MWSAATGGLDLATGGVHPTQPNPFHRTLPHIPLLLHPFQSPLSGWCLHCLFYQCNVSQYATCNKVSAFRTTTCLPAFCPRLRQQRFYPFRSGVSPAIFTDVTGVSAPILSGINTAPLCCDATGAFLFLVCIPPVSPPRILLIRKSVLSLP